jgi:hypothetical protein
MDFTEFKRRLGAEPRSPDPELASARGQGPEFAAAAEEAEAFEQKLERALAVPVASELVDDLKQVSRTAPRNRRRTWWPAALAAGLLIAFGGTAMYRQFVPQWDSVEAYVIDHFQHDGVNMLALDASQHEVPDAAAIEAMFGRFEVEAAPALREIVGVIKICVTPDGKGIHMVLNTLEGPTTVIYMPSTVVPDREQFDFDGQHALLVNMEHGSAAIIGADSQGPARLYAFVQDSIRPLQPSG